MHRSLPILGNPWVSKHCFFIWHESDNTFYIQRKTHLIVLYKLLNPGGVTIHSTWTDKVMFRQPVKPVNANAVEQSNIDLHGNSTAIACVQSQLTRGSCLQEVHLTTRSCCSQTTFHF